MDIVPLLADDVDLVAGVVAVENAASALDAPWVHPATTPRFQARLRYGWDLEPGEYVAAVGGDEVVGWAALHTSAWDNLDLGWLETTVHPAHRRRGVGTALFEHVRARALTSGRTKFGAEHWDGSPGEPFLTSHGFVRKSQAINRRQHLADVPLSRIQELYAEACAASAAYELVRIHGRTPDDLMEAVSVMTAAINDAPLDDLDIEDEVFPPERIRNYETANELSGNRSYRLLARHRETGELAGHTVVAVESERSEIGHQHDTSVVRAHRGHRLGLLLKTGMNLWLAETEAQLRTIDTWNAESNDHMISVNEALGYRWMGRGVDCQPG